MAEKKEVVTCAEAKEKWMEAVRDAVSYELKHPGSFPRLSHLAGLIGSEKLSLDEITEEDFWQSVDASLESQKEPKT